MRCISIAAGGLYVALASAASTRWTTSSAPEDALLGNADLAVQAGNPFKNAKLYANKFYAKEIADAIPKIKESGMAAAAKKVAEVPTFFWLDTQAKVPKIKEFVADAKGQTLQIVVYNLPERDCAALASNGELSIDDGGEEKYKEYVNSVVKEIKAANNTKFIITYEPDSLANLVTNMNTPKCKKAEQAYKKLSAFGLKALDLPNVSIYMDGGHAGWLGWDANIGPAAQLYGQIYKSAGSPKAVRGLATNVANYNAWTLPSCPSYAESNKVCDEKKFVNAIAPKLRNAGFPTQFIVDTGRSGVQPTKQIKWGDWCNVIGTGFGPRPTTETGDPLVDAFVWVKPGGESDGTSDTGAKRYDGKCGEPDALKPAPEAGTWFQAYFEQLLKNANPPF